MPSHWRFAEQNFPIPYYQELALEELTDLQLKVSLSLLQQIFEKLSSTDLQYVWKDLH